MVTLRIDQINDDAKSINSDAKINVNIDDNAPQLDSVDDDDELQK
eukprot:CAMPEP_0116874968 /NCGR_PEP_ID=MMETSP0463-20121206/6623_1 /TAXON_ID=181622 /ORGANISM="Strombidinopsis sp, Strain SopsisLIS2011" /LENGTH=44 /DNA_ID= /DNA_START= /DNA_END= /DNA_ORIENTATION=